MRLTELDSDRRSNCDPLARSMHCGDAHALGLETSNGDIQEGCAKFPIWHRYSVSLEINTMCARPLLMP